MFYFTDVLGLSAGFLGLLFFGARLWDAINDPIMELILDNARTRWGKFRPWILTGTILNAIILVFLYTKPLFTGNALYIYISFFYVMMLMMIFKQTDSVILSY
jgi:melibiose permease